MNFADRVKEITTSTSAAVIVLGGAVAKFRSFASSLAIGDTGITVSMDDGNGNWENGEYTLTNATTLTRTAIYASSNGGAPTVFPAGAKEVFCTLASETLNSLSAGMPSIVYSANAPVNTDGKPNNTLYFHTTASNGVISMYIKLGGAYKPVGAATPASGGGTPVAAQMVIFAGQSQCNSNGNTSAQAVPAAIAGPMNDVFIWDPFGKTWLTYQAQVNSAVHLEGGKYPETSNEYFGAEAEYARRWKIDNPGVPLYMIKKGHSTTSLSQAARTANRGCWDPALRSDLYDELVSWVADAKANLTAAGKTVTLRGMNWTQGENDAGSTADAANAYGTNLIAFIDALRNAGTIGATTPFIISRIQTGTWANPAPVRAAQQTVGETKSYCRWFSADSVTIDGADTVHYGPNGVVIHGGLMYDEGLSGAEAARQYAAKMTVAPSSDRLAKLTTFFDSLISNGLWSGISVLQIYASHAEQAALVNARNVPVVAANSGMTFTADQGFTGTSTASFINTNVNPVTGDSKLAPGNVSYATYIRGNLATNGCDVGFVPTTSGKGILLYFTQATGNASFRVNTMDVNANNTFAGPSDISGLWSVSRKSVNSTTCFQKGTQVGITDTVNADVGESSNVIFVGNRNSGNNTSGTNGTTRQYGMFIAGAGRTPAQEAALNSAVTAYLTSIGAN